MTREEILKMLAKKSLNQLAKEITFERRVKESPYLESLHTPETAKIAFSDDFDIDNLPMKIMYNFSNTDIYFNLEDYELIKEKVFFEKDNIKKCLKDGVVIPVNAFVNPDDERAYKLHNCIANEWEYIKRELELILNMPLNPNVSNDAKVSNDTTDTECPDIDLTDLF
jgi:hypothetical protein